MKIYIIAVLVCLLPLHAEEPVEAGDVMWIGPGWYGHEWLSDEDEFDIWRTESLVQPEVAVEESIIPTEAIE